MQQDNNSSHSTAQHHSLLTSDRLADDFNSTMRDIDEPSVSETAMSDVRIDETLRSEASSQHQHLGLKIQSQTPADAMDTGSPTNSAEYQTVMPSPTTPSFPPRSKSPTEAFVNMSMSPGSKRSIAYFTEGPNDDLCKEAKRRRRETHDVVITDSNPQPSPTAARVAESIRRSGSRPRMYRCRSHSLPDSTTLARIAQGELDLNLCRVSRIPSALLLLPSLSAEILPSSPSGKSRRFRDRPMPPPITRSSLRELDTSEILKNAQLIHDIIHDPSLQFRPNLEGPRGERKRQAAEQYWHALEREVDRLKICLQKDPAGLVKLSSNRFPVLFTEMKDILCSLLPPPDRVIVEEVIDPDFLCQQLFRGVLDVDNLSRFLGRTMKEHCAPMRDAMVEKMMEQFQYAQKSGLTSAFVSGLRMVFELLEGMKLDVANHQLRTMKKDLQDRAVANEREYFEDRIAKGKIDLAPVIDWIKPALQADLPLSHFTRFSKAFVRLLSPSSSSVQIPSTFLFDGPRLANFRKDFRDLISVQLCLLLYRELSMSLHPASKPPTDSSFNALRLEIWSLLCDLPESTKYSLASPSLAVQIALRAVQHGQPTATVPPAHLVSVAQRWIDQNVVETTGKMFSLSEKRVQEYFVEHLVSAQGCCIPQTPLRGCECEGRIVWAIGTETAMWLLGERMHRVAAFHWTVFGDVYIKGSQEQKTVVGETAM